MQYAHIKRIFDIIFAAVVLILMLPLMGLVGLLIKISMGGPILFSQIRPGKDCVLFKMYKFRSMSPIKDNIFTPDEVRITRLGKFLRSTSIDELPELINVLKGEMSLVGPRPLLVDYLPSYTSNQLRRHQVRPGITGLAQIRGRNTLSWRNKFRYDVFYVDNVSLALDMTILITTIKVVFKKSGFKVAGEGQRFDENSNPKLL